MDSMFAFVLATKDLLRKSTNNNTNYTIQHLPKASSSFVCFHWVFVALIGHKMAAVLLQALWEFLYEQYICFWCLKLWLA